MSIRNVSLLVLCMMVFPSCRSHKEVATERVSLSHWDEWKYNFNDTLSIPSIFFNVDSPRTVQIVRHSNATATHTQLAQDTTTRDCESATRVGSCSVSSTDFLSHKCDSIFRLTVVVLLLVCIAFVVRRFVKKG